MIFETKIFRGLFSHLYFRMIFVIRVPHITATHCMLYRYALSIKSLPKKLKISAHTRVEVGWASAKLLQTRGNGINFSRFMQTSFMDDPLALAINISMCNLFFVLTILRLIKIHR